MIAQLILPVALLSAQALSLPPAQPSSCQVAVKTPPAPLTAEVRWITSLDTALGATAGELRERRLSLREARVEQVEANGFWIGGAEGPCRLFVVPAEGPLIHVRPGDLVDLQGEFRVRSPRTTAEDAPDGLYVYAYIVRPAPAP